MAVSFRLQFSPPFACAFGGDILPDKKDISFRFGRIFLL